MAGPSSPAAQTPKAMSSRLMTMKFMQRAAASASTTGPSTPAVSSPKRRKLDSSSTPATPTSDLQEIQIALAVEDAKRREALERQGKDAGETRWALSFKANSYSEHGAFGKCTMRVSHISQDEIDSTWSGLLTEVRDDERMGSWRDTNALGRRSFGQFNKALERSQQSSGASLSSSSEDSPMSGSDEDSEFEHREEDDPMDTHDPIKATRGVSQHAYKAELKIERKAGRKEERARPLRPAREQKMKTTGLSGLLAVSGVKATRLREAEGARNTKASLQRLEDDVTCYKCGGKGHMAKGCPIRSGEQSKQRHERDGSPRVAKPKRARIN